MSPQLLVTLGPDKGCVFLLVPGQPVQIGRGLGAAVRLTDPTVSRLHCEIVYDGPQPVAVNRSDYGTAVNNRRVDRQPLRPGDALRLGGTELCYFSGTQMDAATLVPPDLDLAAGQLNELAGQTLEGYALDEVLVLRAPSAVFAARHLSTGSAVALKVFAHAFARVPEERERFLRGARTMLRLRHPNLVTVREVGLSGPFCWCALDYVEGCSLGQLLREPDTAGRLDWQDVLTVARQVAGALEHLHSRGIVHRNVTPGNILLRRHDRQALLNDPVLACALDEPEEQQVTRPGELLGDLPYLAPERTRALVRGDERADLYALGATLYHLLTGRPPFIAPSLPELLELIRAGEPEDFGGNGSRTTSSAVPRGFRSAVLRLLAKDPSRRYPSASALLDDLEPLAGVDCPPVLVPAAPSSKAPVETALSRLRGVVRARESSWIAHYQLVRQLGEGGMGTVWLAEDVKLQRPVALKVMQPRLARNPEARQRFLREARATAAIKHDNVVTIYEVDQHEGVPYLVMEYLEGSSLDDWLAQAPRPDAAEVLRIGREAASGLEAAHERGLIHRDIKPSNIWLEGEPGVGASGGRVKLLDFGLAHFAGGERLTQEGDVVGTLGYMAPEQARGKPVDERADLFSLGCVLYEVCAGQPPFTGANPLAVLDALNDPPPPLQPLRPDLPALVVGLVELLLSRDPADRPASATNVIRMIRALEAHGAVLPTPRAS